MTLNLLPLLLSQASDLVLEQPTAAHAWFEAALEYLAPPLLGLLGTLLTAVLAKVGLYLHSREKESKLASALAVSFESAKSVVLEVQATLLPKLQAALADGKFTDAERKQLKDEAMSLLKTRLPAATFKVLSGTFGGLLESFLSKQVETAVSEMKRVGLDDQVAKELKPNP